MIILGVDLIKKIVITEKAFVISENNQYTFDVDRKLTKPKIKILIEALFRVKVLSVNTHILPLKKRRLGPFQGEKTSFKRAIIKLVPGSKIPIFS